MNTIIAIICVAVVLRWGHIPIMLARYVSQDRIRRVLALSANGHDQDTLDEIRARHWDLTSRWGQRHSLTCLWSRVTWSDIGWDRASGLYFAHWLFRVTGMQVTLREWWGVWHARTMLRAYDKVLQHVWLARHRR